MEILYHKILILFLIMSVLFIYPLNVSAEDYIPAYDTETGEPVPDISEMPEESTTEIESHEDDLSVEDPAPEESTKADPYLENTEYQEESTSYVGDDDSYSNSISTEDGRSGESEESEPSDNQISQQADYSEIIASMNIIHEDLQKLMISIWCLCGLILGTKLIKGLFGYG